MTKKHSGLIWLIYPGQTISDPTPLRFLKVALEVTFKFQFKLKNSDICGIKVTPENKNELFKKILLDFGIGAKRNTGYGALVETNNQNA